MKNPENQIINPDALNNEMRRYLSPISAHNFEEHNLKYKANPGSFYLVTSGYQLSTVSDIQKLIDTLRHVQLAAAVDAVVSELNKPLEI